MHYATSAMTRDYVVNNMPERGVKFLSRIASPGTVIVPKDIKRNVKSHQEPISAPKAAVTTTPIHLAETIPETHVLTHAPGFTVFNNIYMYNGTLYIISSELGTTFPEARFMISTPIQALNTDENKRMREPTHKDIVVIVPEQARALWGAASSSQSIIKHRIQTVEGNTVSTDAFAIELLSHTYDTDFDQRS